MKIGFTGSSRSILTAKQFAELTWIFTHRSNAVLIHGGCIGADNSADMLAAQLGVKRVVYPASDVSPDKRIPPEKLRARGAVVIMPARPALKRNRLIVSDSDLLVACPRTKTEELRSGTWATVRYARKWWAEKPDRIKVVTP